MRKILTFALWAFALWVVAFMVIRAVLGSVGDSVQGLQSPVDGVMATIQAEEGFRGSPYQDTEGVWTVGYGTKLPITEAEGVYLARERLQGQQDALVAALPWSVSHPMTTREALLDMAYQLGVRGLEGFTAMLSALQSGDCAAAKAAALDSAWARQTPSRAALSGRSALLASSPAIRDLFNCSTQLFYLLDHYVVLIHEVVAARVCSGVTHKDTLDFSQPFP